MANEFTWKRPKGDEDEEELLRQQEEFLKTKQQPCTKLKSSTNIRTPNVSKVKSQFASLRKIGEKQDIILTSQGSGDVINSAIKDKIQENSQRKLEDVINSPMVNQSSSTYPNFILGNIVEKKFDIEKHKFVDNHVSAASELGFPKVFRSDNVVHVEKKTSGESLFWQKLQLLRGASVEIQKDEPSSSNKEDSSVAVDDQMTIEIHQENLEKLAQMSEAEILEEKKKLEETLDSKIIQFLKNRNKKSGKRSIGQSSMQSNVSAASETTMNTETSNGKKIKFSSNEKSDTQMDCENDTSNISAAKETIMNTEVSSDKKKFSSNNDTMNEMDCENDISSIPKSPKEILKESKQKGWLHMDTPEPEKLKWMEDLPVEKKDEPAPNEEYNARFDFNGLLLPYKDESLTVDKGLHHHGEEPERPGYSLQELLQLSRSSTQQQRCTALTTLANIMEKSRKGWYDKALHPAPLTALSQKNILLLLRFSLDDSSIAVVTTALQALRAFLVSEADEVCLDRLQGLDKYVEPTLMPELEDTDTSSLKDHELAQLDAVAVLLRSDFLLRVRYILNEMHPPPVGVTCALEILARLARHSHTTALNISSTPLLLDIIIRNFMPLSTNRLAMQDVINDVYGIPVIQAIKLCRVLVTYGKKPVAQKLDNSKIIEVILSYISSDTGKKDDINLSIESLRLWRMMLHHKRGLDSVAGALLTLRSQLQLLLDNYDIQSASELACEHAAALIAIASRDKALQQSLSTLLAKWSTQFSLISNATWGVTKLIAETLSAVDEISELRTTWLDNQNVFSTLRSSSNLLSDCIPAANREPSCLPNLGVLTENGELQPIVSVNSCIPFLATVLRKFNNSNRYVRKIGAILQHPVFGKYMRNLEANEWSLERSWYSRTELDLLTAVVRAASFLGDAIDQQTAQIVWKIAVKLVSALPADATRDVRELLQIALSNEKVHLEIITKELAKLDLTSAVDRAQIGLRSDTASRYARYIIPNGDWSQAAMPKDWLFLPLVHTYNKCKNDVKVQQEEWDDVLTVLSLTLVLPDLMETLSPTLRFSRLVLVYLCDTVYLSENVSALLVNVVSSLLRRYHARLNFQTELPGLSSFTDLFTALCEHFYSSSYGDDGFAMVLLVPVAQRHDAHYRKLLWSEHAAALRYLKLPVEKLAVPLKEYLCPEEDDVSLIESYIKALFHGTVKETWCPIPYAIALHHSAMYLKRANKAAVSWRTRVEQSRNKDLTSKLLCYTPPL